MTTGNRTFTMVKPDAVAAGNTGNILAMIEQAGFKGKRFGDAGIHTKQALVLVNYGNATGNEIWNVAQNIQKTIFEKYGISIETEVNVI
jgi:UDP-N-acetylmuramate dehydrogenase